MATVQDFKNLGIKIRRKEGYVDFFQLKEIQLEGETVVSTREEIPGLLEVPPDATLEEVNDAVHRINEVLRSRFNLRYEGDLDEEEEEEEEDFVKLEPLPGAPGSTLGEPGPETNPGTEGEG